MTGTNEEIVINRNDLIKEIQNHTPSPEEESFIPEFLELLKSDRCFYRDHFEPGHITGSAILFNMDGDRILMNHHKSLNMWMNFGGHADGEEDILAVAIREAMEESGITALKPISADFIDIDIHDIPENTKKGEPAHKHFDIRYVMQMTTEQNFKISDESLDLKWMDIDTAIEKVDESSKRLIKKAVKTL